MQTALQVSIESTCASSSSAEFEVSLKKVVKHHFKRQKNTSLIWLWILLLSFLYSLLCRWGLAIILSIRCPFDTVVSWATCCCQGGGSVLLSTSNFVAPLHSSSHLWYILKYLHEAVYLENLTSKRKKENSFCWGVARLLSTE